MNQLKLLLLAAGIAFLGFTSPLVHGTPMVIDNFDQYASGTYLQNLPNARWSRFGNATADGIYSIAGGVGGTRGASYLVNFSPSSAVNGSVRHTFSTSQSFTQPIIFSLDLAVSVIRPGTTVFAQISSSAGTPTIFETLVGQSLTNTGFQTFTFSFDPESVRHIQGGQSLEAVLADLKSVTFRFNNTVDSGSQSILFDNLTVVASIPEPSLAWFALLGSSLIFGVAIARRRASAG